MRRPLSSYNVFTKEMFKRMSEESSDLSFAEKSKLISKMWNEMPENKKKVYNDQGEINKNTYRTRIKLITGHCQTPEQDTAVEPLVKTKSYRCNKNNEKLAFERALQKNAESIQALQKSIQRSAFLQQCTALGCFACICVSAYLFLSLRSCACI
ncbi:hypothetical protein BY458DRAFT_506959 [Sporodiniella umbellata]|nr:hypothetical protein BY458DRAFT_506959 [Sporodiniella umbellata]